MLFAYTTHDFVNDQFHENAFKSYTSLDWQKINIFQPLVQKYKIQMTDYVTDDNWLTFGVHNITYPVVHKEEVQSDNNIGMVCGVSIVMSMDKMFWSRRVYSIGDWMNEIGGFSQTIMLFVTLMVPMFQTDSFDKYLIQLLYKKQKLEDPNLLKFE